MKTCRKNLLCYALIFLTAFILRILIASSRFVDEDEVFAYAPAVNRILEGDFEVNLAHPMLIKLFFAVSAWLMGEGGKLGVLFPWLPISIGSMRLVSVTLGSLTCILIYLLVNELFNNRFAALLSGLVLALDPIALGVSSYATLDSGMVFFFMLTFFLFHRYIVRGGHYLELSAISYALTVSSKYFGFIAIFPILGLVVWKHTVRRTIKPFITFRVKKPIKSLIMFLSISFIVFIIFSQPNPWRNLPISLSFNAAHLSMGHKVKPPGKPFIIPETMLRGDPWIYYESNPLASKPDYFADMSDGVYSPWWYLIYIQAGYSTPYQLLIYLIFTLILVKSIIMKRLDGKLAIIMIAVLTPFIYFTFQSVRLPQYVILSSTIASILSAVVYLRSSKVSRFILLICFIVMHVYFVIFCIKIAGIDIVGWTFYQKNPILPLIESFFGWLYRIQ